MEQRTRKSYELITPDDFFPSKALFALREIIVGRHVAHLRLHPRGVTTSQDALYKNKARASILCEHYLAEIAIIPLIVHDRSSVD